MLAAAGFMAQEAVSGKTWSQQDVNFEGLLLGGYFSQEAAEVARDAAASARRARGAHAALLCAEARRRARTLTRPSPEPEP